MNVALHALCLFTLAFGVHLLLWHTARPRRHTAALLAIFSSALACWWVANQAPVFARPLNSWQQLQLAVVHTSLSLAYTVAYSALEHRSPSMTLLVAVANAGPKGASHDDLARLLTSLSPVEIRLEAMVRENLVWISAQGYRLTAKGRAWARLFSTWRSLFGVPHGG